VWIRLSVVLRGIKTLLVCSHRMVALAAASRQLATRWFYFLVANVSVAVSCLIFLFFVSRQGFCPRQKTKKEKRM
jgi:hypothetical protein